MRWTPGRGHVLRFYEVCLWETLSGTSHSVPFFSVTPEDLVTLHNEWQSWEDDKDVRVTAVRCLLREKTGRRKKELQSQRRWRRKEGGFSQWHPESHLGQVHTTSWRSFSLYSLFVGPTAPWQQEGAAVCFPPRTGILRKSILPH